jgi:plasmid stability protein
MPSLLIKRLPPYLLQKLQEAARSHHRSLSGEAVAILERAFRDDGPSVPAFEPVCGPIPLTQELLDRARHEDRP